MRTPYFLLLTVSLAFLVACSPTASMPMGDEHSNHQMSDTAGSGEMNHDEHHMGEAAGSGEMSHDEMQAKMAEMMTDMMAEEGMTAAEMEAMMAEHHGEEMNHEEMQTMMMGMMQEMMSDKGMAGDMPAMMSHEDMSQMSHEEMQTKMAEMMVMMMAEEGMTAEEMEAMMAEHHGEEMSHEEMQAMMMEMMTEMGSAEAADHQHEEGDEHSQSGSASELVVETKGFSYAPAVIEVVVGQPVQLTLKNSDVLEHDFTVVKIAAADVHEESVASAEHAHHGSSEYDLHVSALGGKSGTLTFTPTEPGTYEIFCTVAGHKEAGMVATLEVVEQK